MNNMIYNSPYTWISNDKSLVLYVRVVYFNAYSKYSAWGSFMRIASILPKWCMYLNSLNNFDIQVSKRAYLKLIMYDNDAARQVALMSPPSRRNMADITPRNLSC